MKIYTEINYIWKDNKLVQTDSKSFDYEGEIESCHWYHRHGGASEVKKVVKKVKDTVKKGPGGDLKKVVDKVYGGDTKKAVESVQKTYRDFEGGANYYINKAQGKSDDDDDDSNDNGDSSKLSGQALALTQGGGDVEARREIQSRSEMGLTQGRKRTLLTA